MATLQIAPQPHPGNWALRLLHWTPRILAILFVAFLSLFSLDVFGVGYSAWETAVAFFMHNIPSLILIGFIVLAWRWPWVGSIGSGVLMLWFWNMHDFNWAGDWVGLILFGAVPALIALLFAADWLVRRRRYG